MYLSTKKVTYLRVKDHAVSGEEFELVCHAELDLLATEPQPTKENLSGYYTSEDYISHTDSKRNLFEIAYHLVRDLSLKRKLKLIKTLCSSEKNLLDVGCGTGDFLIKAKDHGWTVCGIEPNDKARAIANKKTNNAVFEIDELLQIKKQSFDVITLWHVLEHLPNLEHHIAVFKSLLKPHGKLIIAVPNYKSYDAKYYASFWAAYDVPRHLWHFSRTAIKQLFHKDDMIVEKELPMKFDAYYVCLLSENYKSGWMNILRAFIVALRSNLKARTSKEYSSLIYVIKNKQI